MHVDEETLSIIMIFYNSINLLSSVKHVIVLISNTQTLQFGLREEFEIFLKYLPCLSPSLRLQSDPFCLTEERREEERRYKECLELLGPLSRSGLEIERADQRETPIQQAER